MLVGKIKEHLFGDSLTVVFRKGIQKIFVQPGQAQLLADRLLVPDEIRFPAALSADHQAAHRLQNLPPGKPVIQFFQHPAAQRLILPDDAGQFCSFYSQFLCHQPLSGAVIQGLKFHGSDSVEKLGQLIPYIQSLLIQKRAAASFSEQDFQLTQNFPRILKAPVFVAHGIQVKQKIICPALLHISSQKASERIFSFLIRLCQDSRVLIETVQNRLFHFSVLYLLAALCQVCFCLLLFSQHSCQLRLGQGQLKRLPSTHAELLQFFCHPIFQDIRLFFLSLILQAQRQIPGISFIPRLPSPHRKSMGLDGHLYGFIHGLYGDAAVILPAVKSRGIDAVMEITFPLLKILVADGLFQTLNKSSFHPDRHRKVSPAFFPYFHDVGDSLIGSIVLPMEPFHAELYRFLGA